MLMPMSLSSSLVRLGKGSVHGVPAAANDVRELRAVVVTRWRLAQQAEVAIGRGDQLGIRRLARAYERLLHDAGPDAAIPGLDHLPNEVHAAIHGLQDRLYRIQSKLQFTSDERLDLDQRGCEPRARLVEQDE